MHMLMGNICHASAFLPFLYLFQYLLIASFWNFSEENTADFNTVTGAQFRISWMWFQIELNETKILHMLWLYRAVIIL